MPHAHFILGVFNLGVLLATSGVLVTGDSNHLHTDFTPVSTAVSFSTNESVSPPSSSGNGIHGLQQGTDACVSGSVCVCV